MSRPPLPPIDFRALAEALLARSHELVPRWLPGGTQRGHEYVCGSLSGGTGASCSVNLSTGRWADFAGDDETKGGDLLALYAAIHEIDQGAAALRVAREEGLESVAGIVSTGAGASTPPPPPRPPPAPAAASREPPEGWKTLIPVPPTAPAPTFRHPYRRLEDLVHKAEYAVGDHVLGYVIRFRTSDGGKDVLPYTWCVSERDGGAAWKWRQWDEPRPLYYPGRAHPEGRTVVLVEGEIKAEVLQNLLDVAAPGVYCVVSWSGGCKAWPKSSWQWLKNSTVLLWPDCDAKREKLSKAERDSCLDDAAMAIAAAGKPFQPVEKQPGMVAMMGIGALLRDSHECNVSMLQIPNPGDVVDGWDCADAINVDGWDGARVLAFFGWAVPFVAAPVDLSVLLGKKGAAPAPAAETSRDGPAAADGESKLPWWLSRFINPNTGLVQMSRKAVIACLRNDEDLVDCLGFNELSGEVSTREPWPWREQGGPVVDNDDLRLGDWLSAKYKVPAAARAALTEAMHTVADSRPYHPVREYLKGLKHDGRPRAEKWLMHVLHIDPELLDGKRHTYLRMVSKFWLMGMVARVFEPGCKFDYSLVLEGLTGRRKSALFEAMAGREYFSDTHFDIGGNKDGFDQLQGLWLYELAEMSALRKADSDSVKAFFTSKSDRYRASYGRYVQNHPRQCVIGCTINRRQYLYDTTGNRRFWPVWVDQPIRIEWFVKWRDQLFAEAVALYESGERYYPTLEEERLYFVPEQELRLVETGVQAELLRLLTRQGAAGDGVEGASSQVNELTMFVTISQLVRALGTDVGKSTAVLESQIRGWLEAENWERGRSGVGARPWGWKRPAGWPRPPDDESITDAGPDGPDDDTGRHAQAAMTGGEDDLPI